MLMIVQDQCYYYKLLTMQIIILADQVLNIDVLVQVCVMLRSIIYNLDLFGEQRAGYSLHA